MKQRQSPQTRVARSGGLIKTLLSATWPVALGVAHTSQADTTNMAASAADQVQEVVVTATRRSERLQDVPISVSAFSQENMQAQGLHDIDDVTRVSPGVTFSRNGMGSSANYNDEGSDISIRGIDSTAGTSTTGLYIDDTPIQTRHVGFGSINPFPQLFDLERVEVLRGPQGTLFGAGAEGGAVRFISPEPSFKGLTSYVRADIASTEGGALSYETGAAVGAPIIDDTLAFRFSASFRRDGGWVDRVGYTLVPNSSVLTPTPVYNGITTAANANWQETSTARLALTWRIGDAVEVSPSIYYQRLQIGDTGAYWVALSDRVRGIYRNGNAGRNSSDDPFTLSAVKVKWDLGFAQMFSNTSFFSRSQSSNSDYTQYLRATWASLGELPNTFPAPGDRGYSGFQDNQRNFYQELRLASSDAAARALWTVGLFFSHQKEDVPQTIVDPTLDPEIISYTAAAASLCSAAQPCPGGLILSEPIDRMVDEQVAAFGEATFKLTDTFKTTLGLRLSRLQYTGVVSENGPFLGTQVAASSSARENAVTPKATFAWQPDRDDLLYVSASKGFRPGGVNVGVGDICGSDLASLGVPVVNGQRQVPERFASDSLWSYEIGSKNSFANRKIQLAASLFYIDWTNIQQNVYLPGCGEQFTANLGKARSRGGDLDLTYQPLDALSLHGSAAYTDAKFTKTSCAGALTFSQLSCSGTDPVTGQSMTAAPIASEGDALLGAPWSFTAAVDYHRSLWTAQAYLRADYQYTTAQHSLLPAQDPRNALVDQTISGLPSTQNLNLRGGFRWRGLDLSVYANNVTNAHPLMFESRDIAGAYGTVPVDTLYFGRGVRPRTIGITTAYRY